MLEQPVLALNYTAGFTSLAPFFIGVIGLYILLRFIRLLGRLSPPEPEPIPIPHRDDCPNCKQPPPEYVPYNQGPGEYQYGGQVTYPNSSGGYYREQMPCRFHDFAAYLSYCRRHKLKP